MTKMSVESLELQFADGFSHKEMLAITGIANARLMSWYKRRSLPVGFPDAPGRGNRRRYDDRGVRILLAMRALADAGLPLEDASVLALRFAVQMGTILMPVRWRPLKEAVKEITFDSKSFTVTTGAWPDEVVMIVKKPEWWSEKTWEDMGILPGMPHFESNGFVALTTPASDTLKALRSWMRNDIHVRALTILDIHALVIDYLVGLKSLSEARQSPDDN